MLELSPGRRLFALAAIALASASAACGGSGDGGSGTLPTLAASFTPDVASPGPNSVAMTEGARSGDTVTIRVRVVDVQDLFGASFDVRFDPALAAFVRHAPGTALEQGGAAVRYDVALASAGRLVVSATRLAPAPGVDVAGSLPVIDLVFRALDSGSSAVTFEGASLFDDQLPPQPIAGLQWHSGVLSAV